MFCRERYQHWLLVGSYLVGILGTAVCLALLFLLAGRLDYWQGWLFAWVTLFFISAALYIFQNDKDLSKERIKPGPGTKWWDKVFFVFYVPLNAAVLVTASLDTGRFFWSPELPPVVYFSGYLLYITAQITIMWSMRINRFFSSTVRIQRERGQYVIQEGPYRYVRHPGYVGGISLALGMALSLGSLWALIPAGGAVTALVIRTLLEDRTLQKELPGYSEYAQRVKSRLIPGLW